MTKDQIMKDILLRVYHKAHEDFRQGRFRHYDDLFFKDQLKLVVKEMISEQKAREWLGLSCSKLPQEIIQKYYGFLLENYIKIGKRSGII